MGRLLCVAFLGQILAGSAFAIAEPILLSWRNHEAAS
jgi:hypothetical protein